MSDELFFHVSKGELPPGAAFHYDERDPLGRLAHAVTASAELDAPLPRAPWRQRWREALERHWPLNDAERLLHLAALESRLLARLRETPDAPRLRAFLRSLGPPGPTPFDGLMRWLPADGDGEWFDQALRLSAAGAAGGASYEVLFPGTWGNEAGLIRARLTQLAARDDRPRVLLAAWSHYLLTQADARQLAEQFDALARHHPDRLGDQRFLLELLPLEQWSSFSPPTVAVEGQSLGLAVLLAAWAAGTQPSLTSLIATGQLLDGEVRGVDATYEKSGVVLRFLERDQPHRFLVPAENAAEVREELRTRYPGRVLPVARDVAALFAATDLLTDGCDGYRALLAARAAEWTLTPDVGDDTFGLFDASDVQELNKATSMALPFGNDPKRAMLHVIANVHAADVVALPLSLAGDESGPDRLARRVARGLRDAGAAVASEALRNLIGTFGDRVLLVAYGERLARHDAEAQRWRQVRDDVAALARRPRLLLLASDAHHLGRLGVPE